MSELASLAHRAAEPRGIEPVFQRHSDEMKTKTFSFRSSLVEIKRVAGDLKEYESEITNVLTKRCWEHFNGYFFVTANKQKFMKGGGEGQLKESFLWFYDMNGAAGLNELQKAKFFELFSVEGLNLEKVLEELHGVPGHRGRKSLFLAFATKLLHTIDNSLPIYDSHIASVFKLPNQVAYGDNIALGVQQRIEIYKKLLERFEKLYRCKETGEYLKDVREKLQNEHFCWRDDLISDEKLLDSALWALYTVKNS